MQVGEKNALCISENDDLTQIGLLTLPRHTDSAKRGPKAERKGGIRAIPKPRFAEALRELELLTCVERMRREQYTYTESITELAETFMRARLVSLDGGPSVDIVKDLTLVGRDEDCDVRLDHKSVSKLHCAIVKTDGLLLIRDLGSTNGTRVNGQRVRRAALLPKDTLAVATLRFQVSFGVDLEREIGPDSPKKKPEVPATPLRLNALPDVYPEPKTPKNFPEPPT